jgi:hypothetical protein
VIVRFVDIGGIVEHHCLEVIVCFVDIDGIVEHHCLEVIVRHTIYHMHNIDNLVQLQSFLLLFEVISKPSALDDYLLFIL